MRPGTGPGRLSSFRTTATAAVAAIADPIAHGGPVTDRTLAFSLPATATHRGASIPVPFPFSVPGPANGQGDTRRNRRSGSASWCVATGRVRHSRRARMACNRRYGSRPIDAANPRSVLEDFVPGGHGLRGPASARQPSETFKGERDRQRA